MIKNLPANAGDAGSTPGSGRSTGEGNGNSLQYSCPEKHMDRDEYMDNLEKDMIDLVWTKGKEVWEVSLRKQGLCWVLNMVRTQVS